MNHIRLLLDWLNTRSWASAYLGRQRRSTARDFERIGRFRESSTLVVDDPERWGRYLRDSDGTPSVAYRRNYCCEHSNGLRCPVHGTLILDESGSVAGVIQPRKDCL